MASTDTATELHAQLEESLRNLVTSQDWLGAIEVASRFHDYSFANTQLIWLQATGRGFTPTRVAGYRMWQQLGRQVRSGEHGIRILAPVTRRLPTNTGNPGDLGTETGDQRDERRRVVGFRVVHVFDITQTDGEPLPDMRPELITGNLPQQWEHLTALITAEGFTLSTVDPGQLGSANGMTSWSDQRVLLRDGLSGAQRFKTAAHELAHIRLHNPKGGTRPLCRGVIEVEAESVAYIVAAAAGIDTTSYSLPYVATWSGGDPSIVAATAQRVVTCAQDILPGLQPRELDHTTTPAGAEAPAKQLERETVDADRATPRHPGSSTGEADPAMYTIHPPGHGAILTQNGGCATCAAEATHLVVYDGPGRPGTHGDAYHELACTAHAERARRGGAMAYPKSVLPGHTPPPRPVPSPDTARTDRLEEALQQAIDLYRTWLDSPEGEPGRRHLDQRRITPEITERFQVGYAPPKWDTLTTVLKREGFTDQELLDAGVTGRARTGRLYDRMRGRLVFPIHDHNGRPRGLAGRLLTGDGPKYLNSPQTELYHKGELLYGLHLARPHILTAGGAVVVEGYLDAIAAHQTGITNTVAIAGTAITQHHLATLRRTTRNITLALDGDTPGQAVADRIPDLTDFARLDLDIKVATLPPGRDPANLVADGEPELLDKALNDAAPLPIHLIDRTLNRHNLNEIEAKVRALRAAAAIIIGIADPETRAAATDHLAHRLNWDSTTAEAQLAPYLTGSRPPHRVGRGPSLDLSR